MAAFDQAESILDNATLRVVHRFAGLPRQRRRPSAFRRSLSRLEAARDIVCIGRYWQLYYRRYRQNVLDGLCAALGLSSGSVARRRCERDSEWIQEAVPTLAEQARPFPSIEEDVVDLAELTFPAERSPGNVCDLKHLYRPLQAKPRDVPWRDITGLPTEHASVLSLLEHLAEASTSAMTPPHVVADYAPSRFAVNLGAASGACLEKGGPDHDPANCLILKNGFAGLLVEGSTDARSSLIRLYRDRSDVATHFEPITPAGLAEVFEIGRVPTSPDLLKIDLDNGDVDFLEAALRLRRPKLVHFEFAAQFPPPVIYREPFSELRLPDTALYIERHQRKDRVGLFVGGSLSANLDVARRFGYGLVHVEFANALLVREDLPGAKDLLSKHPVFEAWLVGYYCHPLRRALWFSDEREARRAFHMDTAKWGDSRTPEASRDQLVLQTIAWSLPANLAHWPQMKLA
eukprot:TRINITY_DN75168_c0_g1_i1.p1 TRINITY_DN75168_c0_g1~~TRINITY_DN75168_c0_g1_i1.p1  ORF type:complete len:529 (-),score=53.00 TRINITY_DN75168_c0_g1_i1:48-1427(-)